MSNVVSLADFRLDKYVMELSHRIFTRDDIDLRCGDALVELRTIPDASVHLIACDLPFEMTHAHWDQMIPMAELFAEYRRILTPLGTMVLNGSGIFSAMLTMAAPDLFKYSLVWEKNRNTTPQHAKNRPLNFHEDVLVFSKGKVAHKLPAKTGSKDRMTYNPQGVAALENPRVTKVQKEAKGVYLSHRKTFDGADTYVQDTTGYPTSILKIPVVRNTVHETEKPVALNDWIIRTYSNEGETVLDNCFGSGSCGVAAVVAGRRFIGIERDPNYFEQGKARIMAATVPRAA